MIVFYPGNLGNARRPPWFFGRPPVRRPAGGTLREIARDSALFKHSVMRGYVIDTWCCDDLSDLISLLPIDILNYENTVSFWVLFRCQWEKINFYHINLNTQMENCYFGLN